MLRILIADDHSILRRGARAILEEHEGWEVCAEASNGRDAVELAGRLRPDLCVLDVSMPGLNGIEATRQIRAALPDTEVVVLTVHDSEELPASILAAGARGYVLKADLAQDLTAAVEAVARHAPFFSHKAQPAPVLRAERGRPARSRPGSSRPGKGRSCSSSQKDRAPAASRRISGSARRPSRRIARRSFASSASSPWRTWCGSRSGTGSRAPDRPQRGFTKSFFSSASQSTEEATAAQIVQSPPSSGTVENARCRNGR
jgi:DNA-binding NarL/FixJ family response regulator